jgi:hypothetical protein
MIHFTETGVEVDASADALDRAAEQFRERELLHLPGLLTPSFRQSIREGIERDGFEDDDDTAPQAGQPRFVGEYQNAKVGQDLRDGATLRAIRDRANDQNLFDFVERIVGCAPVGECVGRVFRLKPAGDDLPWHTDAEGGRVADLIIDLATTPFEGGRFQMRDAHTEQIMNDVGQLTFGDALLIRISPDIEHHYTAITGSTPKTLFSGWMAPARSA